MDANPATAAPAITPPPEGADGGSGGFAPNAYDASDPGSFAADNICP